MRTFYHTHSGFTLVELLVYMSIFAVVSLLVIQGLLVSMRSFASARQHRELATTATAITERIAYDVRRARTVETADSVLGIHPGELVVTTLDDDGTTIIERSFSLDTGRVLLGEDGVSIGVLGDESIVITNLVFSELTTTNSTGVMVDMTLQHTKDTNYEIDISHTIGLRGSY